MNKCINATPNQIKQILSNEQSKYASGEISWNVSNQFNEVILDSAITNVNSDSVDAFANFFKNTNFESVSPMDVARFFSDFDVVEPSRAWFD